LKEKEEEQEQEKEAASKTLQSEKWELNSSSSLSQESLFVFAQETGELTSTPVNK
jgi:hypothetical protein